MKLSSRNRSIFWLVIIFGALGGSLAWEIFERICYYLGMELSLGVGPIGFDLSVLAVYLTLNPGSFLGVLAGILLFRLI